jgi:hypothetical protein
MSDTVNETLYFQDIYLLSRINSNTIETVVGDE